MESMVNGKNYSVSNFCEKMFDSEFIILNREILYNIFKHHSHLSGLDFFFHEHMAILNYIYSGSVVLNLKNTGLHAYLLSQLKNSQPALEKYSQLIDKKAIGETTTIKTTIKLHDCIGALLSLFYFSKLNGKQRE